MQKMKLLKRQTNLFISCVITKKKKKDTCMHKTKNAFTATCSLTFTIISTLSRLGVFNRIRITFLMHRTMENIETWLTYFLHPDKDDEKEISRARVPLKVCHTFP